MSSSTPPDSSPTPSEAPWTVRRLLDWIRKYLGEKEVDSPRVCAELLLGHVLGCERLRLYMTPDLEPDPEQLSNLRALVGRAADHEPVQYLVGVWPFHGREFEVAPCTLIPRPATELLVDRALDEIRARGIRQSWNLLDLCTGSGCVAVSLLATLHAARVGPLSERFQAGESRELPGVDEVDPEEEVALDLELQPVTSRSTAPGRDQNSEQVESDVPRLSELEPLGALRLIATDIVPEALALAERNANRHGVAEFIEWALGSLWEPLSPEQLGSFDIICTNPPYVSDSEYLALDRNVRDFEPEQALRGGGDGLELVRPIIQSASDWLRPNGLLLLELGAHSAERALQEARALDQFEFLEIQEDHEGFPRMLVARNRS
ncbi:MAG: protein-(glutamine-N5) methyltransferase, release factor-specific [Planctomycetes bacterium TMED75]|nr:protein-(glutamine-N5) methyltransferase, release factor-specific [Planctomycetaceae bacterium]OUU91862.1 MAG: protein-(glutamine-N5) methyltransferase, release factor-specific [Planctomycetes bacterium TMED75]